MPQLLDPNFHRTVVFMLEHDDGGSFGLVINRDTDLPVSGLCESLEIAWEGSPDALVRWGGPVQPEQGCLLLGERAPDHSNVVGVTDGIRFARSLDVLREVARRPGPDAAVFLGYAGWGPGQLVEEMIQGAWLVAPVAPGFVFGARREGLWEEVVRHLGIDPATLVPTQGVN